MVVLSNCSRIFCYVNNTSFFYSIGIYFFAIRPSLRRDVLWYTSVRLSVRLSVRPFHMSRSNLRTPWPIHFKFHRVIDIEVLIICMLYGEISNFHSRVVGLYSSNCRRFFVCRDVNWELLSQFTSNFAQLLELIVLRSVYSLVKFRFFIPELWDFIHQIVGDLSHVALEIENPFTNSLQTSHCYWNDSLDWFLKKCCFHLYKYCINVPIHVYGAAVGEI